jgi:hypothetical protein
MTKKYQSNYEVVSRLPAWFNIKMGMRSSGIKDEGQFRVYLTRWKKEGMIGSLGNRTGLYWNILKEPNASKALLSAVKNLYPEAVVIGDSSLYYHGIITQLPKALCIGILNQRSCPNISGVDFQLFSKRMFEKLEQNQMILSEKEAMNGMGFREVKPEASLAIQLKMSNSPDVDDLYLDDLDRDIFSLALDVFSVPDSEELEMISDEMGLFNKPYFSP